MKRIPLAALAVAVLVLPLIPAGPAAAATADPPWYGYRIDAGDNAAGHWIGGRSYSARAYRLDPRAKPATSGFGATYTVDDLHGSGPIEVTPSLTARAAWILGKYGTYPDATQAAAVDVATYHLLHGGAYSLSGWRTAQRLSDSGHGADIRSLATTMLSMSKRYAGPYRVTVKAPGTPVGGQVPVTVKVVSTRTGEGIEKLPVAVSFAGGTAVDLVTGSTGVASASFAASRAGELPVVARVEKLPETRLVVRRPTTKGASRIATAGVKTARVVSTTVPVQAIPTVAATAKATPINVGQYAAGSFTLGGSYGDVARTATISLHGPFSDGAAANCAPATAVSTHTRSVTNGSHQLPSHKISRYGLYLWRVTVAGDRLNTTASTCSAGTRVRTVPAVYAKARYASYSLGSKARAYVILGRLPASYTGTATVKLYGPFSSRDNVSCPSTKVIREVELPLTEDGTFLAPQVTLSRAGYYTWRARVPSSFFSASVVSECEGEDSTFRMIG